MSVCFFGCYNMWIILNHFSWQAPLKVRVQLSNFTKKLRLPPKVTLQLHQILRLPRTLTLQHHNFTEYCGCWESDSPTSPHMLPPLRVSLFDILWSWSVTLPGRGQYFVKLDCHFSFPKCEHKYCTANGLVADDGFILGSCSDNNNISWHHIFHLTTNHLTSPPLTSQPTTSHHTTRYIASHNSTPHHTITWCAKENSVWAAHRLVALCAFYRQILSLACRDFPPELPPRDRPEPTTGNGYNA